MRSKKFAEILLITCFVVFLGVTMFFTVENRDNEYSYYENRNYAVMPEATRESFLDGSYLDELETFLSDHSAFREILVKAQTYADVNILKRPVVNDVVVTDKALLPYNAYETVDENTVKEKAETIASMNKELKDVIESYGGHYIYTAVPCQYACYEDLYPSYLNSRSQYTDLELKYLSQAMEKQDISFIDMMEIFRSSENPAETYVAVSDEGVGGSLYYSSAIDNHYDVRGGFIAYKAIIDRINQETEFKLEYPDDDEITFVPHELPYRGSRTRKLLDVTNFSEHLHRAVFSEELPFKRYDKGTHVPSYIYDEDHTVLDGMITYGYYMGGDISNTVIDTNRPELPSILIYGDSFTNTIESVAYYSFDEQHSLDLRYYDEMTLQEYIKKYKPEIVVCVRDYFSLLAPEGNGQITK